VEVKILTYNWGTGAQFTRRAQLAAILAPYDTLHDRPAAAGIYDGQKKGRDQAALIASC